MQTIRLMVLLTAALLIVETTRAQDSVATHHFSLRQALEYAEKNNVQVKNALLDVALQEQVNREVTGSAYPHIAASGDITNNLKLPVSIIPAGTAFAPGQPPSEEDLYLTFGIKWSTQGGVSLNQILFDGQVFTGLQARGSLMDFKRKTAEVTAEQIRATVSKVYYQLVLSRVQIALLDSNIALVEKNKHDTKIMYDNGFVENLEIDKLDVQLANLKSQKIQTINSVNNGYLGLKVLMGMPIREQLVLTDKLTDEDIREGVLEASGFDYGQRRDYQAALLGIKLNEYEVQRYKKSRLPSLSLSGYWNEMSMANRFGNLYNSESFWFPVSALSLKLSVPIFTGFANNARIHQAKIKLQQSQNQAEALKLSIDQQRDSSINTFQMAITDMDYQKKNMSLAERVYSHTKKKYEVGIGSQIEIENARVQLQSAQTNYFSSLYNAVIAKIDFLKASSKL